MTKRRARSLDRLDRLRTYRVTTLEERVNFLAESFKKLDLEGQQQLLALAMALCQSNREPSSTCGRNVKSRKNLVKSRRNLACFAQ
jgi:hypothetical protein